MGVLQWYKDRTLLLTGATGYMGKVLVEKVLRALPGVRRVYLLLRPRRGISPAARLQELLDLPLFERLRREAPQALDKLSVLEGDLQRPGLGLSAAQRARLAAEVSVVFHGAAALSMDAPLAESARSNVMGTANVLELCRGLPLLQAFVHLSTTATQCEAKVVEERTYPSPVPPADFLHLMDWLDEDTVRALTPRLLKQHPNCYTFTKRLAETLVDEERDKIPVIILRPAIVTPALKEPMRGWVDSLNGPIGLMVGAGKGMVRSMLCGSEYQAEIVPVDVAANVTILAAWDRAVNKRDAKETPVINVTSGDVCNLTFGDMLKKGRKLVWEYPFENVVWYPDGDIRKNRFVHNLIVLFCHILPAYFIDLLLLITFQKRFMVRLQKKISRGLEVLQYFTMREWNLETNNIKKLNNLLTEEEKRIFYTVQFEFDAEDYVRHSILGARQYTMKEPLTSLPRARRHLKLMYVIYLLFNVGLYGGVFYLVASFIRPIQFSMDYCLQFLSNIPMLRSISWP